MAGEPEVRLQLCGGEVDHGTETVDAGTGQSSSNALLDDVEDIVHHAGGQLALLTGIQSHSLPKGKALGEGSRQFWRRRRLYSRLKTFFTVFPAGLIRAQLDEARPCRRSSLPDSRPT